MDEAYETLNTPVVADSKEFFSAQEKEMPPSVAVHIEALPIQEEPLSVENLSSSKPWLRHVPISVFSIPLGLAGYAGLWNSWADTDAFKDIPVYIISWIFFICSAIVALVITSLYMIKVSHHRSIVRHEFAISSRAMTFFSPLLSALVFLRSKPTAFQNETVMMVIWYLLLTVQSFASFFVYPGFFHESPRNLENVHPTYMMSFMGWLMLASTAWLTNSDEVAIVCFSIGMLMMLIVNSAVVSAMIHTPKNFYDDPALFLLLAPIAMAAIAYQQIDSSASTPLFTRIFIYIDVFLLTLFIRFGYKTLFHTKPVRLIGMHWTYTFPLSSLATASISAAINMDSTLMWVLAVGLSIAASGVTCIAIGHLVVLLISLFQQKISLHDPILAKCELV